MAHDGPSAQLQAELRQSMQSALAAQRPILHHLNADSTWLLQIPRPATAVKRGARFYYNILLDPWLTGGQSDVASWFSQQFHAEPSAMQSVAEVDALAREHEMLAADLLHRHTHRGRRTARAEGMDADADHLDGTLIDAVAVSHEFTDHCHKETLLQVHPDVPVFAIKEAAALIESWKHFRAVITVPGFGDGGDTDWRSTSVPPLPEWVGISRLLQAEDVLNYHAALMITFNNRRGNAESKRKDADDPPHARTRSSRARTTWQATDDDDETAEAIIYTPHGIYSGDLAMVTGASPAISTLAFLHGLHNVRVGTVGGRAALQSNLGAHNGLQAQRLLNADYWISTHDEIKKGGGLVSWFIQREVISIKDALDLERKSRARSDGHCHDSELDKVLDSFDDTKWVDLRNGESIILR